MKYAEERLATDLHRELKRRLASHSMEIAIAGAGVDWRCMVQRGNSACTISCFDSYGGEYYTAFQRDSTDMATARASSRDATIAAVADWLAGHDVALLYERYAFVDQTK